MKDKTAPHVLPAGMSVGSFAATQQDSESKP